MLFWVLYIRGVSFHIVVDFYTYLRASITIKRGGPLKFVMDLATSKSLRPAPYTYTTGTLIVIVC
jgi:hypothetical protein